MEDSHVFVVTGGGILLIGGDVELMTLLDGDVLVVDGVSGTDLRTFLRGGVSGVLETEILFATYGVKSNGKGTALLSLLSLTGVVDDGLVVLIRAVREVHADNVETSYCLSACVIFPSGSSIPIPLRSALIFSVELVLGPEKIDISNCPTKKRSRANSKHTNGSDDGGTAEVLGRDHLGVELGVPLQLHTVAEVVEGVGGSHFEDELG